MNLLNNFPIDNALAICNTSLFGLLLFSVSATFETQCI